MNLGHKSYKTRLIARTGNKAAYGHTIIGYHPLHQCNKHLRRAQYDLYVWEIEEIDKKSRMPS